MKYQFKHIPANTAYYYIIPELLKILKELDFKLDSEILEVGCGQGDLIEILYHLGLNNIRGFDIQESIISLAKRNFPVISGKFFQHDAYQLRLPGGIPQSYDLIIAMEIIEHLYSPEVFLDNAFNWLNKNGYLIITTPYHGYFKNLLIALTNKFDRHFNPLSGNPHVKFFSRKTLPLLLEKQRFKIIKFKGVGRIIYFWKSMLFIAIKK
jgi:2-polyprenyl-3-methyl-5-hydroxy-6-metoxy-1,4-benzoquinol methylase